MLTLAVLTFKIKGSDKKFKPSHYSITITPYPNLQILLDKRIEFGTLREVKKVIWHPRAKETVQGFPKEIKNELGYLIYKLQLGEQLAMPQSRPMKTVASGVLELRIKDASGIYRVFYLLKAKDGILVFHAFKKKDQRTPPYEIHQGSKNLKELFDDY